MNRLLSIAFYKFKMMMSDRLFFAAMIIIPLLITLAAGYALRYEKMDTIPIAVVDEDMSDNSVLLLERISRKEGIQLKIANQKEAVEMLENYQVEQVVVIGKGFGESVRQGVSEGLIDLINSPSSQSAGFTQEVVASEAMRLITANMAANNVEQQYQELGITIESGFKAKVAAFADELWDPEPLLTIEYRELEAGADKPVSKEMLPASSASSAGLIIAFMMFYMLYGSGWVIEERLNGTIKRLGAGKGAVALSFQGSILALLFAGTLQIFMFSAVLRIFFDITLFRGVFSYLVLFVYLLAVIAISMFLASVLKTQAQLQAGAPVLALFTGFAGGCFWNFVEMPERIRTLSLFTPQGWALGALNALLLNPADTTAIINPVLILFTAALILLPASYIIINMQLRQG